MDLPSNGYASMIEHTEVAPSDASRWNTGYPILDFYEKFIIAFVDGLDARQPGLKNQITVVIGGSLGGNMTLRLARRDPATYPWLRRVVSWSPASSWPSWESQPPTDLRHIAAFGAGVRMVMPEGTDTLDEFFFGVGGRNRQSDEWYSASWPCRQNAVTASHRGIYEIYNTRFRRWHWRVAYEQVIYSHWDSDNPNPAIGPARYSRIRSKMLFATGYNDNNSPVWLFTEARQLARAMTMVEGTGLMVAATGHSIDTEKPAFFAGRILDFLYEAPVPPFPFFLNPSTTIDR
jgi:pimeloyl-ACP methyl ester carboxylesterase